MTKMICRVIAAAAACLAVTGSVMAEDYKLPDATEMQSYSGEAQQFYNAGVAALDRVDYSGAYNQFSKAAQLEPGAIRLNRLAAGLAVKHGRGSSADKARDFFETAVVCYRSILAQPHLEPEIRREVENQLKVTLDEQANLAQRDVKREAVGTVFITELNRTYAPPTPRSGNKTGPVSAPAVPAVGGNPLQTSGLPSVPGVEPTPQGPLVPGASTPAPPPSLPTLPSPDQNPIPSGRVVQLPRLFPAPHLRPELYLRRLAPELQRQQRFNCCRQLRAATLLRISQA